MHKQQLDGNIAFIDNTKINKKSSSKKTTFLIILLVFLILLLITAILITIKYPKFLDFKL